MRHRGEKTIGRNGHFFPTVLNSRRRRSTFLFIIHTISSVLPLIPAFTHLVEEIRVMGPAVGRSFERVERR